MKIYTLGNGFIASHLPYNPILDRVSPNEKQIKELLTWYKPDIIVNCIGRTGSPNIDFCETHKEETHTANVVIPTMFAHECEKLGIRFIHLGSGCVMYGQSPHGRDEMHCLLWDDAIPYKVRIDTGWKETDITSPKSYYSQTKYECDNNLKDMKNTTILRLRMPISSKKHPRNLLNKLIKYKQVLDEPNSMTFVSDLVNAIDFVINKELYGIYNVASPLPLKHSDLLEEYRKYVPNHTYQRINKETLDKMVIAPRSNCILDMNKIMNEGFKFGDTDTLVRECIKNYVKEING
jgi:UDP-glucose 4,6-dehydratase